MAQRLWWRILAFCDSYHQDEEPEMADEYWSLVGASEHLLGSNLGFLADVYMCRAPQLSQCPGPLTSEAESQALHVGRT